VNIKEVVMAKEERTNLKGETTDRVFQNKMLEYLDISNQSLALGNNDTVKPINSTPLLLLH
jgi:hypothetical protein